MAICPDCAAQMKNSPDDQNPMKRTILLPSVLTTGILAVVVLAFWGCASIRPDVGSPDPATFSLRLHENGKDVQRIASPAWTPDENVLLRRWTESFGKGGSVSFVTFAPGLVVSSDSFHANFLSDGTLVLNARSARGGKKWTQLVRKRTELDAAVFAAARSKFAGDEISATASSAPAESGAEEAIARYLRESVAPNYGGEWEHCVPFVRIVATDDTDPSDIRAWGEFRVFNYRLEGDTFHFVSGGNHPGLMHLRETDGALAVVFFDPVLDGSEYTPSAKRIFGKHYKAWMALVADDKALEAARLQDLADYAAENNLPAKFAKDYGWDPVPLPPAHPATL